MIVIILVCLVVFSIILNKFKAGKIVNFFLTLTLISFVFLFITYTPDKAFYQLWIDYPEYSFDKEPVFLLVTNYLRKHNLSYDYLHITFICIYTLMYLALFQRFKTNILITSLLYFSLIFIFYGTQLRFFLGYFAVLLALYFSYNKINFWSILLFIFGILSHYSVALLIPTYFILRIKQDFHKQILKLSFTVFLGYIVMSQIITILLSGSRFYPYVSGSLVSSYIGGLFTFLPYLPIYFFIFKYYKMRIIENRSLLDDANFIFLYKMSLIPALFVGIALNTQVIGHRFIMPSLIFPITFFFYRFQNINKSNKLKFLIIFLFLYIYIFVHMNFSTAIFLNNTSVIDDISKMINSNKYLRYLLFTN